VLMEALPRNAAGKVLKRILRDRFGSAAPRKAGGSG
jgi:acyl-coenzyme A synthetase/AMP-(fatty) acid ligase